MFHFHRLSVLALLATCCLTPAARGEDFRVDNAVYVAGQSQPQSRSTTIFYDGRVYDFLSDPAEVIIFDKAQGQFTLLDVARRVRSELTTRDVKTFADRARQRLARHSSPAVKFLGDPVFEESGDKASELSLTSPWMTYQIRMQASSTEVAAQYREFSDWYAQMNATLNPASRPPFARLKVNEAIQRGGGVAQEVRLTLNSTNGEPPHHLRSRHQLAPKLDPSDDSRVAEAREYLRTFQPVSFEEYRRSK